MKTIEQLRSEKNELQENIKKEIRTFLDKNPGIHLSVDVSFTTQEMYDGTEVLTSINVNVKAVV